MTDACLRSRSRSRLCCVALMSGANAISGITVVGAIALAGSGNADMAQWLGAGAVALASVNVVGGYMVTDRMLGFFKKKEG